ncbi:MAG TPA: response regulator, partial [Pseudomonadales bacterium]|nr:response regulator [Pseudomonadales bacterium]
VPEKIESATPEIKSAPQSVGAGFRIRAQKVSRLLIVEDDEKFSRILSELILDAGLACDVVHNGTDALTYLDHYLPQAIILDVSLPDMPGWEIIKKIKSIPDAANVPVHVVSAMPEKRHAETLGARDFIEKPVSQNDVEELLMRIKEEISGLFSRVLIVEDSVELHEVIAEQFAGRGMDAAFVETGAEALARLAGDSFDCMIVDLKLPDGDGLELLKKIRALPDYAARPIIVFTAEELTPEREFEISKYADRVIIKSNRAMERLLDATLMFVRSVSGDTGVVAEESQAAGESALQDVAASKTVPQTARDYAEADDAVLSGHKVLLVDDDIRNIYSMSAILEDLGMEVVPVMSGAESLEKLAEEQDFNLVLMDIMMPEMDGYEAMRRIRAMQGMSAMPIIALTAKAMKEDRQLCIDAGASDYLSKPVDVDLLKKMMAGWLTGS